MHMGNEYIIGVYGDRNYSYRVGFTKQHTYDGMMTSNQPVLVPT